MSICACNIFVQDSTGARAAACFIVTRRSLGSLALASRTTLRGARAGSTRDKRSAMPVQPRTPPGVLELLPPQQLAFQHMLDTIRRGFERFGFLPVETPAFELTEVLLTKSGGETEKQVYFVQSTGALKQGDAALPELALRFDLTVPLARYVAEHEAQLNFP